MITILSLVCVVLLLVVGLLWSDRKYLVKALDQARTDRNAEIERSRKLRAERIAEAQAHSETIRATTARLRAMSGDIPEIVHNLSVNNSKEN